MYKLPVKKIIVDAFLIPWKARALFLHALSLPVFLLICLWAISTILKPSNPIVIFSLLFLYWAAFAFFAVTCHRLILVTTDNTSTFHSYNTVRIIHFMKWVIIVYGLSIALEMLILTLTMNVIQDFDFDNISRIRDVLYLPLMYLVARVSLIFPATALDLRGSLKWSWNETRNNGINILCIVGLLPWFMYMLLSFLQREESTIVEQAILTLLTYLASAIGIFSLSLTYRALQANAQRQL